MAKVLALDIGKKRTGVAETDPMQIIATGLPTIETINLLPFIEVYVEKEKPECIVIGQPKRLHGEASDVESFIAKVIRKIATRIPHVKIEREDERFTSKMAAATIAQSGLKKKKRMQKGLVDEVSAVIILQSWMSRNSH
jgi:putative Holliday junction resolvase